MSRKISMKLLSYFGLCVFLWINAIASETQIEMKGNESETARGSLVMNLPYCMALTLLNHLEIQQETLFHKSLLEEVYILDEVFVPSGFVSLAFSDNKIESTSTFSGVNVLEEDTQTVTAGIEKKFRWGAVSKIEYTKSTTDSNAAFNIFSPIHDDQLKIEIVQPVLKGFGEELNTALLRKAAIKAKINEMDLSRLIETRLFETYRLYLNLIYRYAEFNRNNENLTVIKLKNDKAKLLFEQGINSTIDFEKSNQELLSAYAELQMAKTSYQEVSLLLLKHIQPYNNKNELYHVIPSSVPDFNAFVSLDTPDADKMVQDALERRPEVDKSQLLIDQNEIDRQIALNQQKSELNLVSIYQSKGVGPSTSESFEDVSGFDFPEWYIGLEYNFLFGNESKRAGIRQVESNLERAKLMRKEVVSEIIRDSIISLSLVHESMARFNAAKKDFAASKYELERHYVSFQNGVIPEIEYLLRQQEFIYGENRALKSFIEYLVSIAAIDVSRHMFSEYWISNLTLDFQSQS